MTNSGWRARAVGNGQRIAGGATDKREARPKTQVEAGKIGQRKGANAAMENLTGDKAEGGCNPGSRRA